jgi:hypothetical protein
VEPDLPVPEIIARELGVEGVVDRSKFAPASLFYLPSAAGFGDLDRHEAHIITGSPYGAASMRQKAGALLAERQAEQDHVAAEAHAAAEKRRQERIAAGFDPDDSLIEKLRAHFDLEGVLLSHGYNKVGSKSGAKYRHPNSQSGSHGADIKTDGGIERVFSHNATDPLHADHLPEWCGVTALDSIDTTIILDYGGDRKKALRELAERFGLAKTAERKALAALVFRMAKQQATQEEIESAAVAEGERLGLSRDEVCSVAVWCTTRLKDAA